MEKKREMGGEESRSGISFRCSVGYPTLYLNLNFSVGHKADAIAIFSFSVDHKADAIAIFFCVGFLADAIAIFLLASVC